MVIAGIHGATSWWWIVTSRVSECRNAARTAADVGRWAAVSEWLDVGHSAAGTVWHGR